MEVLVAMSNVCKDFLQRRVVEKVCPIMSSSLRSLASHQHKSRDNPVYHMTAEYKLQKMLLRLVGELCVKVCCFERWAWKTFTLCSVTLLSLSCKCREVNVNC